MPRDEWYDMIQQFQFSKTPSIYFGVSASGKLPSLTASLGMRALLITGKSSFAAAGLQNRLMEHLRDTLADVRIVSVSGEPSPEIIDGAVQRFSSDKIDVVAAIGGGSVIDAGKAIAAMLPTGGTVIDYLEGVGGRTHSGARLPFIAVPTTAGTGSEATKNAVISRVGPGGFKASLRHDNFTPDIAIVDPALTISCPPAITAACGMDALSQLLESFVSSKAAPLTDALAPAAIKGIFDHIVKATSDGGDIGARSAMAYGALISGMCLANAGLGVVHGLASPLGARVSIPHGVVCALLCAPAFKITINRLTAEKNTAPLLKLAQIGSLISGGNSGDIDGCCALLVEKLYALAGALGIPKLRAYGIGLSDVDSIAAKASNKNNPVALTKNEMREILAEAL